MFATTIGMTDVRLPWIDRTGRFSTLRLIVFLGLIAPALWLLWEVWQNELGPRPLTEAIHQTGLWAVRFLAVTLAITPLRHATRLNKLVSVRRMIGLSVFFYVLVHFTLYICDQHGDLLHVASEIVLRIYLTIGFAAFLCLFALAITSTDGMIKRLGPERWANLHRIVYAVAFLGTIHFFMQSKLDVSESIIMGGIYFLLLAERLMRRFIRDLPGLALFALSCLAAGAMACGEALYYALKTGAPLPMILAANLDFSYAVRPAWFVFGAGLVLVVARSSRPLWRPASNSARRKAPRTETAPVR